MSSSSRPSPSPVVVHVSRRALWTFGLLLLVPWLLCALYLGRHLSSSLPASSAAAAISPANEQIITCKPGPWGDLQYVRILIEPPEEQVVANFPKVDHATWTFKDYDHARFDALWRDAGLTPAERQRIEDPALRETEGNVTRIKAPGDFVLALNPSARATIYSALSVHPENSPQSEPFRFRADRADEWFANSGLKPETVARVKKLLYRRGNSLLFSDQALLLPTVPSLEERARLIKTMARKSTMIVKLRVMPDTDIEALDNYWGRGSRSKDIKPLLQSLPRPADGVTIDIIHLLPRFARSLLYTYPSLSDTASHTYLDCHWTVLNFFNPIPDPRYQDLNEVTAAFTNNYHPTTTSPTFGDIYLFAKPNGDVIHSCVYIADDIVFTKNGASPSSPWILMTLSDVIAFYPSDQPLDVQRYRARDNTRSD